MPGLGFPTRVTRGMRKFRWLPVGGALLASTLLLASATAASPDASDTLQVIGHATSFKAVGPSGAAIPGDELFIGGVVMRPGAPHTQIGTFGVHCVVTGATGQQICNAVYALPRGQITAEVLLPAQPPARFAAAITGGTGAYRNAQGQAVVVTLNQNDESVTFQLSEVGD